MVRFINLKLEGGIMVQEKSWEDFRETGLLWFINIILHLFGWAIVYEVERDEFKRVIKVYPARVSFRGFPEETNDEGYKKVTEYLKENTEKIFSGLID